MNSVTTARARVLPNGSDDWAARSSRLFEDLRRPATAMLRRAFGSVFDDDVIEDIYAAAWAGTLRALQDRQAQLDDDEVRRYVLTAVARHGSKELRRRRRRPTAALDNPEAVGDQGLLPDEQADRHEQATITRDLLSSLPRRRRAVLLLRYGWGLEPAQVCELIEGLSPRAYRKEITKGIDQLTDRFRVLKEGGWCEDREPILKAFAAGFADDEQKRQAQHHLAHCRHCADFVGRLTGHLHDVGSAVALPGVLDLAADGRVSIPDRLGDLVDRGRGSIEGLVSRGGSAPAEAGGVSAVTPRGSGAAGVGILAKLAGLGAVGKLTVACVGSGAAAIICAAAGFEPMQPFDGPATPSADARLAHLRSDLGQSLNQIVTAAPAPPRPSQPEPPAASPLAASETQSAPAPPAAAEVTAPVPVEQSGVAPAQTSDSSRSPGSGARVESAAYEGQDVTSAVASDLARSPTEAGPAVG